MGWFKKISKKLSGKDKAEKKAKEEAARAEAQRRDDYAAEASAGGDGDTQQVFGSQAQSGRVLGIQSSLIASRRKRQAKGGKLGA